MVDNQVAPPAGKLYRLAQVIDLVALSKSEIYRRIKVQQFPAPAKIGLRAVRWRSADIQAWERALPAS